MFTNKADTAKCDSYANSNIVIKDKDKTDYGGFKEWTETTPSPTGDTWHCKYKISVHSDVRGTDVNAKEKLGYILVNVETYGFD